MVDNGHTVVFSPKHSYIQTKDGKKTQIFNKGGVYLMPTWIEKPKVAANKGTRLTGSETGTLAEASGSSGFPRQP